MIPPGSRYEQAERVFAWAHVYNQFGYPILEGEKSNLKVRVVSREATYIIDTPLSQATTGSEYYAKDTENIQFLGYKFLGDAKRWHEIARINTAVWYPLDVKAGTYMKVPTQ